jgi:hypothetical protein
VGLRVTLQLGASKARSRKANRRFRWTRGSRHPRQRGARSAETVTNLDGPQRFKVQFTASEEYIALVEEAKALLAHALPRADLAEIHLRAIRTLVAELKKRKFATPSRHTKRDEVVSSPNDEELRHTAAPARSEPASHHADSPEPHSVAPLKALAEPPRQRDLEPPRQRERHVPAAVRHAVFERDGNRCAYVDSRGEHCRETARLEFHHHIPSSTFGDARHPDSELAPARLRAPNVRVVAIRPLPAPSRQRCGSLATNPTDTLRGGDTGCEAVASSPPA